jgi:ribosome-associated heat shock protein Hsp15
VDNDKEKVRIDKWLWAVRIYKSRTLASEAVDGGKVKLNKESVKPSKSIKVGDEISVRQGFIKKVYKVTGLLEKRVSAEKAALCIQDITPEEDKINNETGQKSYIHRFKGKGRPTKKERRTIEKFKF